MPLLKFIKSFLTIFAIFCFFNHSYADKPWGDDYVEKLKGEKKKVKLYKKWAKSYHKGTKDKDRYLKINEKIIGHKIKIKPKLINVIGLEDKNSMKSYRGKGEMGIVIGAPEHAYHGKEFWTVTVDYSKCVHKEKQNDCTHHRGSARIEQRDKNWTFSDGTEKWFHYAFRPVHNVIFPNEEERKFHIGQCHPSGHNINWMLTIQDGNLYISKFKQRKMIKKFKKNSYNGVDEWTSILINYKLSKTDGILKVYLDQNWNKPVYEYYGPTAEVKDTSKCYVKFGMYTNGNLTAKNPETTENMTVWTDAMTIAKTKDKALELIKKDK